MIELSSVPVPSAFLVPPQHNPTKAYCWGGVAIQDVTRGFYYQLWSTDYKGDVVQAVDVGGRVYDLFKMSGVIRLRLAFDQNMQPLVSYSTVDGVHGFWWYDTELFRHVHTVQEAFPTVGYTDYRDVEIADSTCFVIYNRLGSLRYRLQTDRYRTEHILQDNAPNRIVDYVGMTRGLRLGIRTIYHYLGD